LDMSTILRNEEWLSQIVVVLVHSNLIFPESNLQFGRSTIRSF
jgi:hypothetical protein